MLKYRDQLVPGLWYLRVSTSETLSFSQDYFYTWIPPKHITDILSTDIDLTESTEEELSNDSSRIYTKEINLAVFQSDDLNWLENVCSKQERDELLNKLEVIAAVFYPKSKKVNCISKLRASETSYKGGNKWILDNNDTIVINSHFY